ncbi:DUF4097 family beta strand repeat-containing protein [Pontibacter arcticus]|uniref:Adhesin domain-containing protein n=1 Tax=Pontibacter arcticus TaxID=2080288 RepID=A0A364RHS0_9BACT|nr:hypothetical protein [Pontibacter arcticus]RAU83822.1 hypothetical protein DP923_01790 [Pontibacter arcticus]
MYRSICYLLLAGLFLPLVTVGQQPAPAPPCPVVVNINGQQLTELVALAKFVEAQHQPKITRYRVSGPNQTQPARSTQDQPAPSEEEAVMFAAEKRKTFDKTYKVTTADLLSLDNRFGRIHVNTWPRNEIQVKVEIITRASTDSKAQEILDLISVKDTREGKSIAIKTDIAPMKIVQSNNKSFEINYTVHMPAENALKLKQTFGDAYVSALKGKADLNVKYGSLKTGNLSNVGNSVKVAYGAGNCGFINQGNVEVSYGNMQIEGTNGLQGFSKFSDFKLGKLSDELNMEVKYGTFRVDNINKDIRKINLDIGFTPVVLNFENKAAFNFDVNVKFGSFNYDKSLVNITSLVKDHTSAEYKGRFGGTSSKGLISINSKFGDVQFSE